jgi:hypothetical protein
MNNPKDRFISHLNGFKNALIKSIEKNNQNNLMSIGTALYYNDGRTPFFQLQGLARIDTKLGKGKDKKLATNLLDEFKEIEDAIGKYDYWNTFLENNKRWKFPIEFENYFNKQINYYLGVMEERLARVGWLEKVNNQFVYTDNAFENLRRSLNKMDHHNPEKERKKIVSLFRDEVMEIHDKVKKKQIDLNEIELGVHEFRRKIRWLGIYSSALLGKVRIEKSEKKSPLRQFVTKERMNLKFNQLPIVKEQVAPVYFLQGGFYAISEMISLIGNIKDPGLASEELLNISQLLGQGKSIVKKHLGKEYYTHSKVVNDATAIINNYLLKQNVLLHIADHFDTQL